MTKQEFTELTGLVPTPEEYNEIEAMYYAAPDMSKDEFCKCWRQCGKNPLTVALTKQAITLNGMLEERNNELDDSHDKMKGLAHFLISNSCAYDDMDFYGEALAIIGRKAAVLYKVRMGLPLWAEDRDYINKNLK